MKTTMQIILLGLIAVATSCGDRENFHCADNASCNLSGGGACVSAPSGNMWCAYPDPTCESGYRYSDQDVGDGLADSCVEPGPLDAGVDALSDAPDGGGVTCMPRVAFYDGEDGMREVWVANPDGSGKQNLSNSPLHDDWRPAWSPDGTRVAFESNRRGNYDIFVVNADGSSLVNLTQSNTTADRQPVWSPDGTKILFTRSSTPWVMNADGSGATQVTNLIQVNALAWSPDQTKIVFGHQTSGSPGLFVVPIDGGTPVRISPSGQFASSPAWNRNGKIAFYGGGANTDIFTVNDDGSGLFNVTQSSTNESAPQWASDGSMIVFSTDRSGKRELWRVSHTGGTQTQISTNASTSPSYGDFLTDISSDEMLLLFYRKTSDTNSQVGTIGIDGSNAMTFDAGEGNARGAVFANCP